MFNSSKKNKYTLKYVNEISEKVNNGKSKAISIEHNDSLHLWRIIFELEPERYWFLSVFISDNGIIEKYCLDYEAASDSHYEFKDESSIRKLLYKDGVKNQLLHELFIKYIKKHNGFKLLRLIQPFITAEFHYD